MLELSQGMTAGLVAHRSGKQESWNASTDSNVTSECAKPTCSCKPRAEKSWQCTAEFHDHTITLVSQSCCPLFGRQAIVQGLGLLNSIKASSNLD